MNWTNVIRKSDDSPAIVWWGGPWFLTFIENRAYWEGLENKIEWWQCGVKHLSQWQWNFNIERGKQFFMWNNRGLIMKMQASLWVVALLLVVAAGIVYALSVTPSPSRTAPSVAGGNAPASTGPQLAEKPPESLSPNLNQVDAYEFLDPVPVGKKAPNFTAKTAEGKTIHLADFKGKKNLVMIFYQGSFCPVCGQQLTNVQENLSLFKAQDAEVIAVSADDAIHAKTSVGEHGLTFNVVPDEKKEIIKLFGVGNIRKHGIAWPALFVVDKKGVVQLSFANREGHRLHSNEILPILSKITGKPTPRLNYE